VRRRVGGLLLALGLTAAPAVAEVPISIAASGHATVPVVRGDGRTYEFVFDTGAEGTAVYEAFSRSRNLPPIARRGTVVGQTGSSEVRLVRIATVQVDGVRADNVEAVVLPARADGVALAGIVGLDVFGRQLVDFDLPRRLVDLRPSGDVPSGLDPRRFVPATPTTGGLLSVTVNVDGVDAVAVIDTGARRTRINWRLGRLLGMAPATVGTGQAIQGATNNAVATGEARVRQVRLGARLLADQPVLVADLPVFEAFGVRDRPAIILGMDWLDRTRMVVDFPARKVWFVAARTG
jgi:predicted aspartyl protease